MNGEINMIDIVDIKKAVKNGEIFFYVIEGFSKEGLVSYIYCKNNCGECVKVGEIKEKKEYGITE